MLHSGNAKAQNRSEMLRELLMSVLNLLITTLVLRLVWNTTLVKHIDILKPIKTLFDAFILSLSIQVVRGI